MLKYRNFISFFSTILLYLGVGILFFYLEHNNVGTEQKPQEKVISFSLSEYAPTPPPLETPIEEIVEPEPIPEPPKEVEPELPVVEEVIPEPEPEPIVEKIVPKPLPVVQKKKVLKKKIKKKVKKRILKKRVKKRPNTRKVKKVPKRASKSKASPAKKNAFLAQIRSKISRAKSYPRIAQRRGMQGSVKVTFTILKNGHVSNIQVRGKKVFVKSTKQAVRKAFPISVKNIPMTLPTTVNFTLRYQLLR